MLVCTFFGHRDTPDSVSDVLYEIITDLIIEKRVDMFYVGNNGSFDRIVRKNLKTLKQIYHHIDYAVVLAYMPKSIDDFDDCSDTIYPLELENEPLKFAISKRNLWMISKADYVVSYVKHTASCASKFRETAIKKGKIIIDI